MNRRKAILNQRGGEIAKAGKMFLEALFSPNPQGFFESKGAELERELAERGVLVVEGELEDDPRHRRREAK